MISNRVVPWRRVEPQKGHSNRDLQAILDRVDAFKKVWADDLAGRPSELAEAHARRLRRHAIETGIIEQLYDVAWGVTEALVAEGLTADVAAREGGIDQDALHIIRTQYEALRFCADLAREQIRLTPGILKQLHAALTRAQPTYEATDRLGRRFSARLRHGEWKQAPNHVVRPDGSTLEYTPPEHVAAEIERLCAFNDEVRGHALVRSAWLHHQFTLVHPFEDGNGRVARALVLLELLSEHYAPLVVSRLHRKTYLETLDRANDGDLTPLVTLLCELEIDAMRAEIATIGTSAAGPVVEIAAAHAARITAARADADQNRSVRVGRLADELHHSLADSLRERAEQLLNAFRAADADTHAWSQEATPADDRGRYWRRQLVDAANAADFFVNLAEGTSWVELALRLLGSRLRFVVAIQKVGRGESGVLAVTSFAEWRPDADHEDGGGWQYLMDPRGIPSLTLLESDRAEDRWADLHSYVEETLGAAVDAFARRLGA